MQRRARIELSSGIYQAPNGKVSRVRFDFDGFVSISCIWTTSSPSSSLSMVTINSVSGILLISQDWIESRRRREKAREYRANAMIDPFLTRMLILLFASASLATIREGWEKRRKEKNDEDGDDHDEEDEEGKKMCAYITGFHKDAGTAVNAYLYALVPLTLCLSRNFETLLDQWTIVIRRVVRITMILIQKSIE